MLSVITQTRLASLLQHLGHAQNKLEAYRLQLAQDTLFDPLSAFRLLDTYSKGFLVPSDFYHFLTDHAIFINDQELYILFRTFDELRTGQVTREQFQKIIVPQSEGLRQSLMNRQAYQLKKYLHPLLAKFLQQIVINHRIAEISRQELQICSDYTLGGAMRTLDHSRTGSIYLDDIILFINKGNQLGAAIFTAIDYKRDKIIDIDQLAQALHPLQLYPYPAYRVQINQSFQQQSRRELSRSRNKLRQAELKRSIQKSKLRQIQQRRSQERHRQFYEASPIRRQQQRLIEMDIRARASQRSLERNKYIDRLNRSRLDIQRSRISAQAQHAKDLLDTTSTVYKSKLISPSIRQARLQAIHRSRVQQKYDNQLQNIRLQKRIEQFHMQNLRREQAIRRRESVIGEQIRRSRSRDISNHLHKLQVQNTFRKHQEVNKIQNQLRRSRELVRELELENLKQSEQRALSVLESKIEAKREMQRIANLRRSREIQVQLNIQQNLRRSRDIANRITFQSDLRRSRQATRRIAIQADLKRSRFQAQQDLRRSRQIARNAALENKLRQQQLRRKQIQMAKVIAQNKRRRMQAQEQIRRSQQKAIRITHQNMRRSRQNIKRDQDLRRSRQAARRYAIQQDLIKSRQIENKLAIQEQRRRLLQLQKINRVQRESRQKIDRVRKQKQNLRRSRELQYLKDMEASKAVRQRQIAQQALRREQLLLQKSLQAQKIARRQMYARQANALRQEAMQNELRRSSVQRQNLLRASNNLQREAVHRHNFQIARSSNIRQALSRSKLQAARDSLQRVQNRQLQSIKRQNRLNLQRSRMQRQLTQTKVNRDLQKTRLQSDARLARIQQNLKNSY